MKVKSNSRKRVTTSGYMCFTLDGSSHAQRTAYSSERREQVHEVRKVGACLRCQLLKKSCSKGSPCTTCTQAATKNSASRSLAWMDCLRPSLLNVTIYGSGIHYDPDLKLGGVPVLQYLAHGDVDLKFDIPFEWNIDELSTFVAGWLASDHDAPRASMVGIMSSASLLSVISNLVGPELAQVFKALVYTSSLIFNSSNGRLVYSDKSTDIKVLRHCGHRLLLHLESQIRPAALARLRKQELYALFLLLLGCVISSKYVAESLGDLSRLASASSTRSASRQQTQPSNTFHSDIERGSELVRLLSHQMVYIGHATGLLREGKDKDLIQDLTTSTWRKKAHFTWEAASNGRSFNSFHGHLGTKGPPPEFDFSPHKELNHHDSKLRTSPFTVCGDAQSLRGSFSRSLSSFRQPRSRNSLRFRADGTGRIPPPLAMPIRSTHEAVEHPTEAVAFEQFKGHAEYNQSYARQTALQARSRMATAAHEAPNRITRLQPRDKDKRCMMCLQDHMSWDELYDVKIDNEPMKACQSCLHWFMNQQEPGFAVTDTAQNVYTDRCLSVDSSQTDTESTQISSPPSEVSMAGAWACAVCAFDYTSSDDLMPWTLGDTNCLREMLSGAFICKKCGDAVADLRKGKSTINLVPVTGSNPVIDDHAPEGLHGQNFHEPPSPMDFDMAAFDSSLPTHDIEPWLQEVDNSNVWPCLNRVPTPPPMEIEADLCGGTGQQVEHGESTPVYTYRDYAHVATCSCCRGSVPTAPMLNVNAIGLLQGRLLL